MSPDTADRVRALLQEAAARPCECEHLRSLGIRRPCGPCKARRATAETRTESIDRDVDNFFRRYG